MCIPGFGTGWSGVSPSSVFTSFLTLGTFFNLDLFPVCHLAMLFSCKAVGKIRDDIGKAPPEQHGALSRMHQLQGRGLFSRCSCRHAGRAHNFPRFLTSSCWKVTLEDLCQDKLRRPRLALGSLALWPTGAAAALRRG